MPGIYLHQQPQAATILAQFIAHSGYAEDPIALRHMQLQPRNNQVVPQATAAAAAAAVIGIVAAAGATARAKPVIGILQ